MKLASIIILPLLFPSKAKWLEWETSFLSSQIHKNYERVQVSYRVLQVGVMALARTVAIVLPKPGRK